MVRNGAWGILINDYPDPSLPSVPAWCQGGDTFFNPPAPFDQILGPVIRCYRAPRLRRSRGAQGGRLSTPRP